MSDKPSKLIRIQLNIPEQYKASVTAILDFIAVNTKARFAIVESDPDIIYSDKPAQSHTTQLHFNPEYYLQNKSFKLIISDTGRKQWTFDDHAVVDYIGTIYRFMYLKDEVISTKPLANNFTSFYTTALDKEKQKTIAIPLVDYTVSYLCEDLGVSWELNPKKINVLLTHDVDGPLITSPILILKSAVKFAISGKFKFLWQFLQGVKYFTLNKKGPYWRFAEWAEKEATFGGRSVFFVYPGRKDYNRHMNDPAYSVSNNNDWKVLNQLETKYKCEIGLQPGINAKLSADDIKKDVDILKSMGLRISGTRHHYWELNWQKPWETIQKHYSSGLHYDMSMGWKDKAGFRQGTSFPHQSINFNSPHITIPTQIIDSHLFDYQNYNHDKAMNEVISICKEVAQFNGYLVLDWHERTFEDTPIYKNQSALYFEIISYLCANFEVTFHLPHELAETYIQKYQSLKTIPLS